jgi:hypothetical protein
LVGSTELAERDQIDAHVPLEQRDVRRGAHGIEQRTLDLATGDVAGVHDASFAVAALATELVLPFPVTRKPRARFGQPFDRFRRFTGADVDHHLMAKPRPRHHRVVDVLFERVLRAQHRRDAALSPAGGRFVGGSLGDHHDLPVLLSA